MFMGVIWNIDRDFKTAIAWMLKQREQTGMEIRTEFDAELEYAFWASHDPRNPKRKLAWSGTHNEFRFVSRPSAIARGECTVVQIGTRGDLRFGRDVAIVFFFSGAGGNQYLCT